MRFISATTRVTIGLVCVSISAWLAAFSLGMFPDRQGALMEGRAALCENVALHCSLMASRDDRRMIETALTSLVQRNDDVQSAAIRRPDGSLMVSVGNHTGQWNLPSGNQSTASQMRVPILAGDTEWGTVEVRFRAPAWLDNPLLVLGAFVAAMTYLLYFIYLRKMLQHLDPSRVIPPGVRQTLDTLAEGLLVLDKEERILLANRSFTDILGVTADELTGRNVSDLPWEADERFEEYPWRRAIRDGTPQRGDLMAIHNKDQQERILMVSATPVYSDEGEPRGTLVSLDDVTQLEQSRAELRQMLDSLGKSRDEIHRQNVELEFLASRDPLTACLNRRAFFAELENQWNTAARYDFPLACIMIDLDHFKAINDTHGHQMGDLVLKKTGELLRTDRRPSDLVCRFGGEEFCIVLPHTDLDTACLFAERLRQTIESTSFKNLSITASVGASARSLGAFDPLELIDQSDKSLYVAKRNGRNRVVRFDKVADRTAEYEVEAAINL